MPGIKRSYTGGSSSLGKRSRSFSTKYSQKSRVPSLRGTSGTGYLARSTGRNRFSAGGISASDTPFPAELACKFSYAANGLTRTSASGAFSAKYNFRLHSLFDPDETGVGHQPRYRDTMLGDNGTHAPYREYCVYAAKWAIRAYSTDALTQLMRVAVGTTTAPVASGASVPTSMQECVERPEYEVKMMTPVAGAKPILEFKGYSDLAKMWGKTRAQLLADDNFWADYGTHPANGAELDLFVENTIAESKTVTFDVVITYFCRLRTKTDVSDS